MPPRRPGFRYPRGIAALFGQPPQARMPPGPVVPRVVPARAPGVLTGGKMGWSPQVRPIVRPGVERYVVPVQGIPLTGGQGAATVSSASGAPALVQEISGTATSGTTITLTLPNPTTAGHCLIAYIGAVQGTTNPVVSGITLGGAAGNWASAKSVDSNSEVDCEIWADWNCAGGQTSVVITFTAGTGTGQANLAWLEEWSGLLSAVSPVDQTAGALGISTAPNSGTTPALGQLNELAAGAICGFGTLTAPASPWVSETIITAAGLSLVAAHQVVAATAGLAISGTLSPSGGWGAVVASLKGAVTAVSTAGLATVSVGPQGLGTVWYPASLTVQTTSGVNDNSTCSIYLGPPGQAQGVLLLGTIYPGGYGTNGFALPSMQPGQYLTAQWTGGNPGDTATINVVGSMSCLALRLPV